MSEDCAPCLYSYATSTPSTCRRGGYPVCARCAKEFDTAQKRQTAPRPKRQKRQKRQPFHT